MTHVLGRLLSVADFTKSRAVKQRIGELFDDDETVTRSHDLWVLTSLLAQLDTASWFEERLVLPDEGDRAHRNRIRDRILAAWPTLPVEAAEAAAAQGRAITVDALAGGRWWSLLGQVLDLPLPVQASATMRQLVISSLVNEAAALLAAGRTAEAEMVMGDIDLLLGNASQIPGAKPARAGMTTGGRRPRMPAGGSPSAPAPASADRRTPPPPRLPPGARPGPGAATGNQRQGRPGQPLGPDGDWSGRQGELSRGAAEKLEWLRLLRIQAGTDLGPLDAEAFVRVVYLGAPADVRSLARSILVQQFTTGPNVAMEMIDQFPDAPENEGVSETISRLTGRVLPPASGASWQGEARLALVVHALALRPHGASDIDEWSSALRESYVARLSVQRPDQTDSITLLTPQEAASFLADAWQEKAKITIASTPTPDDLPGLARRRSTRRRLADGPIQLMVAEQLTILDALTYLTVAEQPGQREAALDLLSRSASTRADVNDVLRQALETEQAMGRMWALRLAVREQESSPVPDREDAP